MKPVEIRVSYRNQAGKNEQRDTFTIDVKPWFGMSTIGRPPLYEMAESLGKIQKDFHDIATGWTKPLIRTQTEKEYAEEQKRRIEEVRKQIQEQQTK